VPQQHLSQFSERLPPLPAELIDPTSQVLEHRAFVVVRPQPVQTLFEDVGLEHFPVERE
jgi:hypothetical protein